MKKRFLALSFVSALLLGCTYADLYTVNQKELENEVALTDLEGVFFRSAATTVLLNAAFPLTVSQQIQYRPHQVPMGIITL